jgi:hypothetical protein
MLRQVRSVLQCRRMPPPSPPRRKHQTPASRCPNRTPPSPFASRIDIRDDDLPAAGLQNAGSGKTDTARTAGDEDHGAIPRGFLHPNILLNCATLKPAVVKILLSQLSSSSLCSPPSGKTFELRFFIRFDLPAAIRAHPRLGRWGRVRWQHSARRRAARRQESSGWETSNR